MGEAMKIGALGVAVGALGFYLISKTNIQIGGLGAPAPTPMAPMQQQAPMQGQAQVPMQMPGMATSMYAFGMDPFQNDDQWNNSEVWDTRNRKYFSDNILFNKLPYIPLTTEQDFNPQNLPFSQAYDHNLDQDSPRPRFGTHALDREIADEVYPRKTPLPFYW